MQKFNFILIGVIIGILITLLLVYFRDKNATVGILHIDISHPISDIYQFELNNINTFTLRSKDWVILRIDPNANLKPKMRYNSTEFNLVEYDSQK